MVARAKSRSIFKQYLLLNENNFTEILLKILLLVELTLRFDFERTQVSDPGPRVFFLSLNELYQLKVSFCFLSTTKNGIIDFIFNESIYKSRKQKLSIEMAFLGF